MKRHIVLLALLALCGCGLLTSTPVQRSPHASKSISEMVDEKVARELPRALSSIIGDNVIEWGPYGIAALLALLLGKKHIDFKKISKGKAAGKI